MFFKCKINLIETKIQIQAKKCGCRGGRKFRAVSERKSEGKEVPKISTVVCLVSLPVSAKNGNGRCRHDNIITREQHESTFIVAVLVAYAVRTRAMRSSKNCETTKDCSDTKVLRCVSACGVSKVVLLEMY